MSTSNMNSDTNEQPEKLDIDQLFDEMKVTIKEEETVTEQPEEGNKSRQNKANILIDLAMQTARFFTGSDGKYYASVQRREHKKCYRIHSDMFSDWLTSIYHSECGELPSNPTKANVKSLFAFYATQTTENVFIRVGYANGKVYIDLCTPEGQAIEVDTVSWRIISNPPVHFLCTNSLLSLPIPVPSTDTYLLRKYINIEDEDWSLLAAWIVASLNPHGPYPILVLVGQAGTGKSTLLRVVQKIIDPSGAGLQGPTREERDLFIRAANSWLLCLDNISRLSDDTSDMLCRISTGGGFAKRQLHTDGEEYIINIMRPIAINGIGDIIHRQDLIDRSIIISMPVLAENMRKDEATFWADFERDQPMILGAFLNALSVGLRNLPTVQLNNLPRMADFAKLAVAAEPAYSVSGRSFMDAYRENREMAAETIVESSVLANVLKRLMSGRSTWTGTPKELHEELTRLATEKERTSRQWPKSASTMKTYLDRLAPALRKQSADVQYKRSNGVRRWVIRNMHS